MHMCRMKNIEKFDKNMILQTSIGRKDVKFYSADSECMSLHGIFYENGKYCRMPDSVAKDVSPGIQYGGGLPAGGRLRFVTDSNYLAISVRYGNFETSSIFPIAATAGFDLYEKIDGKQIHLGTYAPPFDLKDYYESEKQLSGSGEHELTLVFPLYSEVKELYIGVAEDASMRPASDYTYSKPIVYYGSSITHGVAASRPGNTYLCQICRELDCDYISLGFGGNAKGEQEMADYIATLDMSAFVLDYDYNAPNAAHLLETHEKFFDIVRTARPEVPIIILSRPKLLTEAEEPRFDAVKATYTHAIEKGDKNVYFIPGYELIPEDVMESAKVDTVHPNDLGFYYMAKRVCRELRRVLSCNN